MKKVIRLTEADLYRIVKRVISEQNFVPVEMDAEYESIKGDKKKTTIRVTEISIETGTSLSVLFLGKIGLGDKQVSQKSTYNCLTKKMTMIDPESFCHKDGECRNTDEVNIENAEELFSKYCPSM